MFALLLPIMQLSVFAFIIYRLAHLYHRLAVGMIDLINVLGEAIVEEKQAYRRVQELIRELQEQKNVG